MSNSINIKSDDLNVFLNISLSSKQDFYGYQQEIDKSATIAGEEHINPIVDGEIRRFKFVNTIASTMKYYFYTTTQPANNFIAAGFTIDELSTITTTTTNSFFILDCYDTFDSYTQTKLFTSYLTKIGKIPEYKYDSINNNATNNQYYYLNVPQSFIDNNSGQTSVIVYVKYSFYNAKTGYVHLFYNKENELLTTPEKMYIKCRLNFLTNTWTFATTNTTAINLYELNPSSGYAERTNNGVDNNNRKQQDYPTGNAFNRETGGYITVS